MVKCNAGRVCRKAWWTDIRSGQGKRDLPSIPGDLIGRPLLTYPPVTVAPRAYSEDIKGPTDRGNKLCRFCSK